MTLSTFWPVLGPLLMKADAAPPAYVYVARLGKYRNTATGQFVSLEAIFNLRDTNETATADTLARLSLALADGQLPTDAWFLAMQQQLRRLTVQQGALGAGGFTALTKRDLKRMDRALQEDWPRLQAFGEAIAKGQLSEAQIRARVKMYAGHARTQFYATQRRPTHKRSEVVLERRVIRPGENCFPAGTLIDTEAGPVPIEAIRVGTKVRTRFGYKAVTRLFAHQTDKPLVTVNAGERTVTCTDNHPFLTQRGWVEAGKLRPTDQVVLLQDSPNGVQRHLALPDAFDLVAAGCEVLVPRSVSFLLTDLAGTERGVPGMAVPPVPVCFNDQVSDLNIDNETGLNHNLGFVGNAQRVKDSDQLPFQAGGAVLSDFGRPFQHLFNHFGVGGDLCAQTFDGSGSAGGVVLPHPFRRLDPIYPFARIVAELKPHSVSTVPHGLMRAAQLFRAPNSPLFGVVGLKKGFFRVGPGDNPIFLVPTLDTEFAIPPLGFTALTEIAARIVSQWRVLAGETNRNFADAGFSTLYTRAFTGPWFCLPGATGKAQFDIAIAGMPTGGADEQFDAFGVFEFRHTLASSELHKDNINHELIIQHSTTVYNFEVEDVHEYIANGFVVHNCDLCSYLASLGWQPYGSLPLPGQPVADWTDGQCYTACRCDLERQVFSRREAKTLVQPIKAFGEFHRNFGIKGGEGSGNFDHAGRPGEVGGSAPATATLDRVWTGEQHEGEATVNKLETGAIGEGIVMDVLTQLHAVPFGTVNVSVNNAPFDVSGDSLAVEVKTGLATNGKSAQHWRATIGQPGKAETELLKQMSAEEKRAHNERKMQAILNRKYALLQRMSEEAGRAIHPLTMGLILSGDGKRADVFAFDGFHLRLPWNKYATDEHFLGTYDVPTQTMHWHERATKAAPVPPQNTETSLNLSEVEQQALDAALAAVDADFQKVFAWWAKQEEGKHGQVDSDR